MVISSFYIEKYFKEKKVKVFHDEENKEIGLQPSNEGYSIQSRSANYIYCRPLARIVIGKFYPSWSEEHQMLVFSYGKESERT